MIKTLTLSNGKQLTLKNSLGFKVRYQQHFGKPCDFAIAEVEKTQDTMVLIQIAYCMAQPVPNEDFEHFCDELDGKDLMPICETVMELYADGMPTEKQLKKAKN